MPLTQPPFETTLVLTGPTASGKSALAMGLAADLDAEIVAMDSMTLYRGMDVGTAKPTADEQRRVPHHLIDVLEPWESGSVAWWLGRAEAACRDITARGKRPLFVGGTPLYLKALIHGLFDGPPADEAVRQELEAEADLHGPAALHERLRAVDPASAARMHPNDVRRVVRALEVWRLTGRPLSDWQQEWTSAPAEENPPRCVALDLPRPELHDRINRRVTAMVDAGWLDEVRHLRTLPRPPSRQAAQAVGYRELGDHLDGRLTLDGAVGLIQARTRQFAKQQLTWLRSMPMCRFRTAQLTMADWRPRIKTSDTITPRAAETHPYGQQPPASR